jgi:hypothetical protein
MGIQTIAWIFVEKKAKLKLSLFGHEELGFFTTINANS